MKKNETMPKEIQDKILETFKARMKHFDIKPKSKKYLEAQQEFLAGAITAIDKAFDNTNSCVPPGWYIQILRGNVID